ncbi:hypothetical protein [Pararhodobacter zhoushanensis]|uniref:Uncharacterized protein n=1 Tax=Pararhodobacter zhoushanensis TaxID=2479545 RepID=A0ABT3GZ38_9RHOB|nr:hypothetical protein [Pararhodobacter zhoushanensis]MCW1932819.1 hypothetical protein [Pararhodobacter zhoushanensis]
MSSELNDLTDLFKSLGAGAPESWASSQIDEGIPQLHRFLFLRQAWAQVVDEQDDSWIDRAIDAARKHPDEPFTGQGHALHRLLAAGAERADLVDLVRASQAEMISRLCYLLEDPSFIGEDATRFGSVGWALVTTDDDFQPTAQTIGGLHESVLDTDPSGREMRPRNRS